MPAINQLRLSIIIPALNEALHIIATLKPLQKIRQAGHEIILCDGGSTDNTVSLSEDLVDHCISSKPGRARQMNAGAQHASGDILCFLHADTLAPESIDQLIIQSLNQSGKLWGRFDIQLSGKQSVFRIIERLINLRSCISSIATGDQGIFIYRPVFHKLFGFADIPLMEDIELSGRLRKISRASCIHKHKLITSSRRWEQNGIISTVVLMWQLRLRYFLGTPARVLAQAYRNSAIK
ncbi:Glycosyl transferase, family 2 [hydrothermal vent metagenome]|uniref:Glycosyl transferase, family 2 n=1 Tax=hydrothermal vent metagenome TaxID=652676 RepID=A0A3B0X6C8_9ZZZZ